MEALGSRSFCFVVKKVGGMLPEAVGPWKYTLLDGQAALALESIEIKDIGMDGKVAADRTGEAMEETFGLNKHENETSEAFIGSSDGRV